MIQNVLETLLSNDSDDLLIEPFCHFHAKSLPLYSKKSSTFRACNCKGVVQPSEGGDAGGQSQSGLESVLKNCCLTLLRWNKALSEGTLSYVITALQQINNK